MVNFIDKNEEKIKDLLFNLYKLNYEKDKLQNDLCRYEYFGDDAKMAKCFREIDDIFAKMKVIKNLLEDLKNGI